MRPQGFACWLLHRGFWLTLVPGVLPWKMDGQHFCPRCDKGGRPGRDSMVRTLLYAPAGAF